LIKNLIYFFLAVVFTACASKENDEKISHPLVLKDGLLYSDSLSTVPFTGRNKSRMLDMKIEYDVVNGKKEGDIIFYYPDDKIQMIGKMKENKNNGEWKYYFPDGSLETSGYFENDIPTGKWTWFYPNGKVVEEGNYVLGKREGEWNNYDSTGKLDIVRLYKENKLIDSTKID
jgi:antitoxin component YwqK of YwqJK toxin-antitoxin module